MIIVVGIFEVAEEDRLRFLASKTDQVSATLAEKGCVDYSFAADGLHPTRVRLAERWDTMEDLEAHVAGLRAAPAPSAPAVPSTMVDMAVYEATPATPPWA